MKNYNNFIGSLAGQESDANMQKYMRNNSFEKVSFEPFSTEDIEKRENEAKLKREKIKECNEKYYSVCHDVSKYVFNEENTESAERQNLVEKIAAEIKIPDAGICGGLRDERFRGYNGFMRFALKNYESNGKIGLDNVQRVTELEILLDKRDSEDIMINCSIDETKGLDLYSLSNRSEGEVGRRRKSECAWFCYGRDKKEAEFDDETVWHRSERYYDDKGYLKMRHQDVVFPTDNSEKEYLSEKAQKTYELMRDAIKVAIDTTETI